MRGFVSHTRYPNTAISGQTVTTSLHLCSAPYSVRCESFVASHGMLPLMLLDTWVSENLQHGRITLRFTTLWSAPAGNNRALFGMLFRLSSGKICPLLDTNVSWLFTSIARIVDIAAPGHQCGLFFTKRTSEFRVRDIVGFSLQIRPPCVFSRKVLACLCRML